MSRSTLAKKSQQRIDVLERKIESLDRQKERAKRQIDEIRCGLCPIAPGDIIRWESGNRERRGRVISVSSGYHDSYEFRCHLLNKNGGTIGYATVRTDRSPTLEKPK